MGSCCCKKLILVCLLISCNAIAGTSQAIIYPAPQGLPASADYEVSVNGKEVFVYASPVPAAYCSFDMSGPVEIIIKAKRDIKWVDVRPLSEGIKPAFKDSTVTIRLRRPAQLSIELNGSIRTPLFLLANAPEKNIPSKKESNVIFFEGGKVHNAGLINVKSNQTVYIAGGAVVVGCILAKDASNVKVLGRGVLDGSWNIRFDDAIIKSGRFGDLPAQERTDSNYTEHRHTLKMIKCNNVLVEGITIHNSTTWTVVPEECSDVVISNIKIISDQPSDDGIDIVHSKNITVKNCFIRTKDDCIAVKAYMHDPVGQKVDSVLIEKCIFWNALWGNALELGFELDGAAVKNITFRNSDVIHVEAGAVFSIHNAGVSAVSDILFDDIRVEDASQKLFDLAIFRSRYSVDGTSDEQEKNRLYLNGAWDGVLKVDAAEKQKHEVYRGKISNIKFRNIKVVDGLFPYSIFYGFSPAKNVSNVLVEKLQVHGRKIVSIKDAKFYLENTANILVR